MNNPDYLLNVGDNFYWGGLFGKCGETPMSKINDITRAQFNWIFENVYKGPGLDGKSAAQLGACPNDPPSLIGSPDILGLGTGDVPPFY